jgi:hypothetical protein
MKLVDDLDTLWKRWSTRIAAMQAGLVLFWTQLPDEWRNAIPSWVLAVTVGICAVSFIGAQAVKQESIQKKGGEDGKPN